MDNVEYICNRGVLSPPIEIRDLNHGFLSYLLRIKASPIEDISFTRVTLEPLSEEFVYLRLPDDIEERKLIRKEWAAKYPHGKYASVNLEFDDDFDKLQEILFNFDEEDMKTVSKVIVETLKEILPSYKPICIIFHGKQLNAEGSAVWTRSPHFHILLQCTTKRRTSEEVQMLNQNTAIYNEARNR